MISISLALGLAEISAAIGFGLMLASMGLMIWRWILIVFYEGIFSELTERCYRAGLHCMFASFSFLILTRIILELPYVQQWP